MRPSSVDLRPASHSFHLTVKSKRGHSGSEFSLVRGGTGKLGIVCNNIRQLSGNSISTARNRNVSALHSLILLDLRKRFLLCHNDFLIEWLSLHENTEKSIQVLLREISSDAQVSLGYLSEVERGQKEASSELLEAICLALGVPLWFVLREVSERMAVSSGIVVPDTVPEDLVPVTLIS